MTAPHIPAGMVAIGPCDEPSQEQRVSWAIEGILIAALRDSRIDGYTKPLSDEMAKAALAVPHIADRDAREAIAEALWNVSHAELYTWQEAKEAGHGWVEGCYQHTDAVLPFLALGSRDAASDATLHEAVDPLKLSGEVSSSVQSTLARDAAVTAPSDGYKQAFYEVAELLGIGAQPLSPREVWEAQMRPKLKALISLTEALERIANYSGGTQYSTITGMRGIAKDTLRALDPVALETGERPSPA